MSLWGQRLKPKTVSDFAGEDEYKKKKHKAILQSIVCAAGGCPEFDDDLLFTQLEKVPCLIKKMEKEAYKPAQEYIPVHVKRRLEKYEKDDKELHIRIQDLQSIDFELRCKIDKLNNEHKEEIEKLKERIKFLEETKEKIYIVKEFK